MSTYQVNYIVSVQTKTARDAINSFKTALNSLTTATKPLADLQRQMTSLSQSRFVIRVDTKPATQKIGKLIRALQMAQAEAKKLGAMGVSMKIPPLKQAKQTVTKSAAAVAPTSKSSTSVATKASSGFLQTPSNLRYQLFGHTPLPNNGGMAIGMLKGMGIAYGLAGLGSLVSNIVSEATEYDNTMKTVENILKSHDKKDNFEGRFASMTRTVRNVGMETKFKVTEVADAAKFLAMAGLDLGDIQQAIRPIADIALVGDTDLGKTADLVTNIMTAYNIPANKMRNAADVMVNTFTMSNTTLTEIAESYKYAASLLSAGGISFEEATAAIGVLGDAGIKGSQAGTTLRTIMANIVNPTKKQRQAWKDIGVSRTNDDGSQKSLLQIFKDLNDKDLDVSSYYKLFHKTAASGAVALTAHVDKWENVFFENFLAKGLSSRLANEKKNTLQGLWSQLVSVITDQGVTAFDGVQGGIRSLLTRAIGFAKSDEALRMIKDLSHAMMEFVDIIISASKWFKEFYDIFGPMIKMWMKFQLFIWPVVKAITALQSVLLGLFGLRKIGAGFLTALSLVFRRVNFLPSALGTAGADGTIAASAGAHKVVSKLPPAVGYSFLPGLSDKQMVMASKGLRNLNDPGLYIKEGMSPRIQNHIQSRWAEYNARHEMEQKIYNSRVRRMQWMNAGAGVGKMALGAGASLFALREMTKKNANGWDAAAGGFYSGAGMAAMAGNAYGLIVAAVLAGLGVGSSLLGHGKRLGELEESLDKFKYDNELINGVFVNSESEVQKSLKFVWTKNYDINELIRERTTLMKEYLGLLSDEDVTTDQIGTETYNTLLDKYQSATLWLMNYGAAQNAANEFNSVFDKYGLSIRNFGGRFAYVNKEGKHIFFNNPDGLSTDENDAVMYDVAGTLGMITGPGSYRDKVVNENIQRAQRLLYSKADAQEVLNAYQAFVDDYGPDSWKDKIRPDQWNLSGDAAAKRKGKELADSYMASEALWTITNPEIKDTYMALFNFKQKQESGALTLHDVWNVLRLTDPQGLGKILAEYNPNNIGAWYNNFGYQDNGEWVDPTHKDTPEVMALTAAGHAKYVLEALQNLGLYDNPAAKELRDNTIALLSLAQAFTGSGQSREGRYDGEILQDPNNQRWSWNASTKQWELLDAEGKPAQIAKGVYDLTNNLSQLSNVVDTLNAQWPAITPLDNTADGVSHGLVTNPVAGGAFYAYTPTLNGLSPISQIFDQYYPTVKDVTYTSATVSPQQMGNILGGKVNAPMGPPKLPTLDDLSNTDDLSDLGSNPFQTTKGGKTSDYKSHYNNTAQPKQININIESLMKVDKIDLSKPENVAVIDSIKREVAYALYEAAADGVTMINGLT